MAQGELRVTVGPLELSSPLVAASGTVGSVWEWAEVADTGYFGAAVAKSVAPEPWKGRPPPRMAPTSVGMLNGIGIQNPGVDAWVEEAGPRIREISAPVWGSAVARDGHGFATVAKGLATAGVTAIEVNLSCPNLEDGQMFSFDAVRSAEVVESVAGVVDIPVGVKLSPNTPDLVGVAGECRRVGADFVVLTNTAMGFGVSLQDRRPLLSGGIGGYSGPGLKPIAMRCVYEVARAMPEVPIVGCGGVSTGADVLEYLLAGASAVEMGTILLAEPKAGARVTRELLQLTERHGIGSLSEIVGGLEDW